MLRIIKHLRVLLTALLSMCALTACTNQDATGNTTNEVPINESQRIENAIQTKAQLAANPQKEFYLSTMNAAPFLPKETDSQSFECQLQSATEAAKRNAGPAYKTAEQVNYQDYGWEQRIAHDPIFFDSTAHHGRVLIIDFAQLDDALAYRYLSNSNTHNQVYEPWSSSKIFAFTGAIAKVREQGLGAQAKIGNTYIADMITGINSYEDFGTASGESNALATFFANLAGRDYLTSLFYDEWLKLSSPGIYFRGAYGPTAFVPDSYTWRMLDTGEEQTVAPYLNASDDPGYLAYRCDTCGLTGNKPMTSLSQAEWLKRLAVHDRDPITQHPNLQAEDVATLFYGAGHSYDDERFAGMTLGISTMLQHALVDAITGKSVRDPKAELDRLTRGEWRVFQKIGWGPSETRSSTENVVLAHVCLPHFQGGREFTVAAQVSVEDAKEENLALAGKKMQALLQRSFTKLFAQ